MKLATIVLTICAAQATFATRTHVKIHHHHQKQTTRTDGLPLPSAWKACTEDIGCQEGLTCVRQLSDFAQCLPPLQEGQLCGHVQDEKPAWRAACQVGLQCALQKANDLFCLPELSSNDQNNSTHTSIQTSKDDSSVLFDGETDSNSSSDDGRDLGSTAAHVWVQCAGTNWQVECESPNVCVYQSDWYSECMPPQLDQGELCGQTGPEQNWQHVCKAGLSCVAKDGKDMRCEAASQKHRKAHATKKSTTPRHKQQSHHGNKKN